MIATYLVLGLVAITALVACAATQPAGERSRHRSAARRHRFVELHPTQVNSHDIHQLLLRDGIDPAQARFVTHRAAEHGIKPFTMWLWLQQHDAGSLAVVVAADLSHQDLLSHLGNGTVPDLEELSLFASANGLAVAGLQDARRQVAVGSAVASRSRKPLPPILEPGVVSTRPVTGGAARRGGDGLAA